MDYLLRDSHHAGVAYGRYDLERLADTVEFCEVPEEGGHELGVGEDGVHAVEALLIARYMMFTQVYFHKTRAIYDFHLVEALKEILKSSGGKFPPPTEDGIKEFLKWDDWRVVGELAAGGGGDHGRILRDRNHFRCIHETAETPSAAEMLAAAEMHTRLKELGSVLIPAEKSWYQPKNNILVAVSEAMGSTRIAPLSERSPVVSGMKPINRRRIYVPMDKREAALEIVRAPSGENHV
jgi:HD superfamily phosphohydrolase